VKDEGLEQLVFWCDPSVDLKAVVAVDSTQLGPAITGIRMRSYAAAHGAQDLPGIVR
jgi:glutamate dehydrogenase/leucine dehydrogenase